MTPATLERITLAGGCFWCLEAVYERVRGVHQVENGYSNGHHPHPNYEQVCSGNTGHAEVVRIDFDPAEVSLRELLEV
ncbi:peptide-methionine (S)-S-oxide reductase, partial [Klebsiella quasipneumoniae]